MPVATTKLLLSFILIHRMPMAPELHTTSQNIELTPLSLVSVIYGAREIIAFRRRIGLKLSFRHLARYYDEAR